MKRPNIVFFFTDDQRFDTIHALGNATIQKPNMDEPAGLREELVRLRDR